MTRSVHCRFNCITVNFDKTQHGIYTIQNFIISLITHLHIKLSADQAFSNQRDQILGQTHNVQPFYQKLNFDQIKGHAQVQASHNRFCVFVNNQILIPLIGSIRLKKLLNGQLTTIKMKIFAQKQFGQKDKIVSLNCKQN